MGSMDISEFITSRMEKILIEWEAFASTFGAAADQMSSHELRDHAKQILEYAAADIRKTESIGETEAKSHGHRDGQTGTDSASSIHGRLRYACGFTLLQLIAEYRALRASVLKLWQEEYPGISAASVNDMMRFNEAIDQSLADAAVAYNAKLSDTRDVFLGILGHDLRSPLAATATAGAYLSRPGAFDEQVAQTGERIKRSAATMTTMVNDLLGLARTQLGDGIQIERRECDLLEMCQWALEDANAAHPRAVFSLHSSGNLIGAFDQARLQQLLTNLANNAAQYGTRETPILVDVAGASDHVVLKVHNHGAAIPTEVLPHLFKLLVQVPERDGNPRSRNSLGLGLYIAKQIAVAHGGDIEVESDGVAGTNFTAVIPRQ